MNPNQGTKSVLSKMPLTFGPHSVRSRMLELNLADDLPEAPPAEAERAHQDHGAHLEHEYDPVQH
jgi:hypothetical protein